MHALVVLVVLSSATPSRADTREERGRALWEEGVARYDSGKFGEAIELFMRAYELTPEPVILFNLCQAHRQARNYERAVFFCRSYLRNAPRAENREVVEQLIIEMDALIAKEKDTGAQPPEGVARPRTRLVRPGDGYQVDEGKPWYADRWAWGVAGTGFVASSIGVGYLIWAGELDQCADEALDSSEVLRLSGEADGKRTIGTIVGIGGAVVLVAGGLMLAWNPQPRQRGLQLAFAADAIILSWGF